MTANRRFVPLERETLREATAFTRSIVSLGGGTITNEENFKIARTHGMLLYLKLSPEEIVKRVQHRNDRPMLRDEHGNQLKGDALRQCVRDLLATREPFYARADIVIAADNMRIGITVDKIVKQLRGLSGKE